MSSLPSSEILEKPKSTILDTLTIIPNESAIMKVPTENLKLCPLGILGKLDGRRNLSHVSAYRRGFAIAAPKTVNPGSRLLRIPNVTHLTKTMLE